VDFAGTLRTLADFLRAAGARYALIGGHALAAYGLPRATLDLDLAVEGAVQDPLVAFLEDRGYETLHRSTGYSNHQHPDAILGRVDFVYVRGGTADELFGACRSLPGPGGLEVPVPRPEHLAAMKVQAMLNDPGRRLQELADIRGLLALPEIDRELVRGYFARHALLEDFDAFDRP